MWPDIEKMIMDLIAPRFGGMSHVGNVTPDLLQSQLPFARVLAIGGDDDWLTETAAVDLDVFAANRNEAWRLAQQCRDDLLVTNVIGTDTLDHARTRVRPRRLPWPDERIILIGATYDLTTRRIA